MFLVPTTTEKIDAERIADRSGPSVYGTVGNFHGGVTDMLSWSTR